MASVPSLRASDADREQVAERLRHATSEGRLTADELDERLSALYASRTYGELEPLVADLPVPRPGRRRAARAPRWAAAACVVAVVLAVLGALASTVRHATASAAAGGHVVMISGPSGPVSALFGAAMSAVSVFAVLFVFFAVIRLLVRSQRPSDV